MFKPIGIAGKLFGKYLKMRNHPAKIRIQNILGRRCFPNGILFEDEHRIQFKLLPNDWITRVFLKSGNYEADSVMLAKQIMNNGGIMLDVGANFGLFSCQIAGTCSGTTVYAIEPNLKVLPQLLHHISINRLDANIKVIQAAASGKYELVSLVQPVSNNLGTTATTAGMIGRLAVPGIPLDFLLGQEKLQSVKLIKMDVEGYEFEVLKNFPFSDFNIENLIIEYNQLGLLTLSEWIGFFKRHGFEARDVFGHTLHGDEMELPDHNIWFVNSKTTTAS